VTLFAIAAIIVAMFFGYFLLKYLPYHERGGPSAEVLKKATD